MKRAAATFVCRGARSVIQCSGLLKRRGHKWRLRTRDADHAVFRLEAYSVTAARAATVLQRRPLTVVESSAEWGVCSNAGAKQGPLGARTRWNLRNEMPEPATFGCLTARMVHCRL